MSFFPITMCLKGIVPKTKIKGIFHLTIKMMLSFTHPQVGSILYEFLSSAEERKEYRKII